MKRLLLVLLMPLAMAGCTNLREIGREPALSPVGAGVQTQPVAAHDFPNKPAPPVTRFSLWDDRQSRLFTDPRALRVGDILTVEIKINDEARFKNDSTRSRQADRSLGLSGAFSVDGTGHSASADGLIGSDSSFTGTGETERSEDMTLEVAAIVTDVQPNGNLRISGSQEVRVNAELRVLTIAGIVRPMDIGPANTVSYERIAEARISYGGRGRLSEVQQPPYGQQVLDAVLPF